MSSDWDFGTFYAAKMGDAKAQGASFYLSTDTTDYPDCNLPIAHEIRRDARSPGTCGKRVWPLGALPEQPETGSKTETSVESDNGVEIRNYDPERRFEGSLCNSGLSDREPSQELRVSGLEQYLCTSPDRMPFMTPKVRRVSLVMRKLQIQRDNQKQVTRDSLKRNEKKRTSNTTMGILEKLYQCLRTNSIPEDMTQHHLDTKTIRITDPGEVGRLVAIGLQVVTLRDEEGLLRHFVDLVTKGSPADRMDLVVEDELLLLTGHLLVNVLPDTMEEYFTNIHVNQQFFMLTRRIAGRKSGIDLHSPEDVGYEYWETKAIIKINARKEAFLAHNSTIKKAHLKNGDIYIAPPGGHLFTGYIRTAQGYLQNVDNKLIVNDRLRDDDPRFLFDLISFDAMLMTKERTLNRKLVMFCQKQEDCIVYFYVNDSGNVILNRVPCDVNVIPEVGELNRAKGTEGFVVNNACFLENSVTENGQIFCLESYIKRGSYLKYQDPEQLMVVEAVKDTTNLMYMTDIQFEIYGA